MRDGVDVDPVPMHGLDGCDAESRQMCCGYDVAIGDGVHLDDNQKGDGTVEAADVED